jgi:hypothetical protein
LLNISKKKKVWWNKVRWIGQMRSDCDPHWCNFSSGGFWLVYGRIVYMNDKCLFLNSSRLCNMKLFNWSQDIINEIFYVKWCLFGESNKNMDAKRILKDCDHHLGYIDQLLCHFRASASGRSYILECAV